MCVDRTGWGSVHTSHGTPGTHITLKGSLTWVPCLCGPPGVGTSSLTLGDTRGRGSGTIPSQKLEWSAAVVEAALWQGHQHLTPDLPWLAVQRPNWWHLAWWPLIQYFHHSHHTICWMMQHSSHLSLECSVHSLMRLEPTSLMLKLFYVSVNDWSWTVLNYPSGLFGPNFIHLKSMLFWKYLTNLGIKCHYNDMWKRRHLLGLQLST